MATRGTIKKSKARTTTTQRWQSLSMGIGAAPISPHSKAAFLFQPPFEEMRLERILVATDYFEILRIAGSYVDEDLPEGFDAFNLASRDLGPQVGCSIPLSVQTKGTVWIWTLVRNRSDAARHFIGALELMVLVPTQQGV